MPTLDSFLAFTFVFGMPAIIYGVDALVRRRRARQLRDAASRADRR